MPAIQPFTDLERVRNKTTADTDDLPDLVIQKYLLSYVGRSSKARILLAAADCIDYLLRELDWNNMKMGTQTLQENIKLENAKRYRKEAYTTSLRLI